MGFLQISELEICVREVVLAARKLKANKASGPDDLTPEFWKTICRTGSPACKWAVELCDKVWMDTHVPHAWHDELVSVTLFLSLPFPFPLTLQVL